jgi:hypothetical protein
MTWLFEISVGLIVAAALMTPLYKLFAPARAGTARPRKKPPRTPT